MSIKEFFEDEPKSTKEVIMRGTFKALRKHGYAGLTIDRIANEVDLSKSSFYHHYANKDGILLEFMEFTLSEIAEQSLAGEEGDPLSSLLAFLDFAVSPTPLDDSDGSANLSIDSETGGVYVEVRAQAAHDEDFREGVTRNDSIFHDHLKTIIQDGIEEGVFRDVDPDRTGEFLLTVIEGMIVRRITSNEPDVRSVRAELDEYLRYRLLDLDAYARYLHQTGYNS